MNLTVDGVAEERASDDSIEQPTRRRNDPRYAFCTSSQTVPGDGLGNEVKQHREYDSGLQSGGDGEGAGAKSFGKGGVDRSDQDASGGSCSKVVRRMHVPLKTLAD